MFRRMQSSRPRADTMFRTLKEELAQLHQPGSYVGEVAQGDGKNKVLVKVHQEGKFVVDVTKDVDMVKLTPGCRIALKADSYTIIKFCQTRVDPLVSLVMVEKVPDSTYEMIGGLDTQIKEIKEVIELPIKHPELSNLWVSLSRSCTAVGPPGYRKDVARSRSCSHNILRGENGERFVSSWPESMLLRYLHGRNRLHWIIRLEGSRSGGDSEVQRTMLELLNQLDGFEPTKNIKVIMATNRMTYWTLRFFALAVLIEKSNSPLQMKGLVLTSSRSTPRK
uniref:Proteasomal ATPase OB C-terminal domain-containing protein n=1 Tax=Ditylenchus dipsaci TaxID=166011 RepID=A0A915DIS0_9BILA